MKSGIYKIICIKNKRIYIGSAIILKNRRQQHFYRLQNKIHHNKHLQRSFNKYGEENFIFEVLEYCEKDQLLIREQFYIDTLKPQFNISLIAGNSSGVKRSQKMKDKLSKLKKGIKLSPQRVEQMKGVLVWNKDRPWTEKEKEKLRKGQLNQEKRTCPYCGKTMNITTSKRYHFDNCKFKAA